MAKVTDFGIARSLDEEGLTADGRVLGTTDYVSPEQALGHAVNGQSDIYSLGIVLYEMLAGDVPFHGENQVAVAMKHVREDVPDIMRLRPEVTASVAAVLDRMTDKALERRYPGHGHARGRPRGRARPRGRPPRPRHRRGDRRPADPSRLGAARHPAADARPPARSPARVLGDPRHRRRAHARARREPATASSAGPARPQATPPTDTEAVSVSGTLGDRLRPRGRRRRRAPTSAPTPSTATRTPPGRPRATRTRSRSAPTASSPASASTSTPSRRSSPPRCGSRRPYPGWDMTLYAAPNGEPPAGHLSGWTEVGGGTVAVQVGRTSSSTRTARPTGTTWSGSPRCRRTPTRWIGQVTLFGDP